MGEPTSAVGCLQELALRRGAGSTSAEQVGGHEVRLGLHELRLAGVTPVCTSANAVAERRGRSARRCRAGPPPSRRASPEPARGRGRPSARCGLPATTGATPWRSPPRPGSPRRPGSVRRASGRWRRRWSPAAARRAGPPRRRSAAARSRSRGGSPPAPRRRRRRAPTTAPRALERLDHARAPRTPAPARRARPGSPRPWPR